MPSGCRAPWPRGRARWRRAARSRPAASAAGRPGALAAAAGRSRSRPGGSRTRSATRARESRWRSWDHAALEHLVRHRRRDLVDERGPHLRVAAQHLDDLLLVGRLRLASLLPELLAGRLLVLLDHPVGDHVQDRELGASNTHEDERQHQRGHAYVLEHVVSSWFRSCYSRTFLWRCASMSRFSSSGVSLGWSIVSVILLILPVNLNGTW